MLGKSITLSKIEKALEKVGMLSKINSMKQGVDTPLTSQLLDSGVE